MMWNTDSKPRLHGAVNTSTHGRPDSTTRRNQKDISPKLSNTATSRRVGRSQMTMTSHGGIHRQKSTGKQSNRSPRRPIREKTSRRSGPQLMLRSRSEWRPAARRTFKINGGLRQTSDEEGPRRTILIVDPRYVHCRHSTRNRALPSPGLA